MSQPSDVTVCAARHDTSMNVKSGPRNAGDQPPTLNCATGENVHTLTTDHQASKSAATGKEIRTAKDGLQPCARYRIIHQGVDPCPEMFPAGLGDLIPYPQR